MLIGQSVIMLLGLGLASWQEGSARWLNRPIDSLDLGFTFSFAIPLIAYAAFFSSTRAQSVAWVQKVVDSFRFGPVKGLLQARAFLIVLFAFVASFGEESLFREFIQMRFGLGLSALLFGAIHPVSVPFFLAMSGFGLIHGILFNLVGHNIWPPVITHFIYNLVGLFLMKAKLLRRWSTT